MLLISMSSILTTTMFFMGSDERPENSQPFCDLTEHSCLLPFSSFGQPRPYSLLATLSEATAQMLLLSRHLFLLVYHGNFTLKALLCHACKSDLSCQLQILSSSLLELIHPLKCRIRVPWSLRRRSQRAGSLTVSCCSFPAEIHIIASTEGSGGVQYPATRCNPIANGKERKTQGHDQHHQALDSDGLLPKAGEILIPDRQKLLLAVGVSHELLGVEGKTSQQSLSTAEHPNTCFCRTQPVKTSWVPPSYQNEGGNQRRKLKSPLLPVLSGS